MRFLLHLARRRILHGSPECPLDLLCGVFAGRAFDTYLMIEGLGGSLIYGAYVAIDLHLIAEKIDIDD
jgi:hypothetical protein